MSCHLLSNVKDKCLDPIFLHTFQSSCHHSVEVHGYSIGSGSVLSSIVYLHFHIRLNPHRGLFQLIDNS